MTKDIGLSVVQHMESDYTIPIINKNGSRLKAADIKPGDEVTIEYDPDREICVVTSIKPATT